MNKKFSSLEQWTLYPENPLKQGYDSLTVDDQDYAGLYSIIGLESRLYLSGMYKFFENIPPHSSLRIRMKTIMYNFGSGADISLQIKADAKFITLFYGHLDAVKNVMYHDYEVNYSSSSTSVFIDLIIEVAGGEINKITFGFREFELYYQKCPEGCLICKSKDTQTSDCNRWQLAQYSLIDQNKLNDGWIIITDQKEQLYQTEYCLDSKKLNFLGFVLASQSIQKILILKPHYKILIQYQQILLGAENTNSIFWYLEIDDNIVMDISYFTYLQGTQICETFNSKSYGDYVKKIKYSDAHYNTTLKVRTFTTGQSTFSKLKWSIKNFEIYIQKCHPDCTESCSGSKANQCTKQKYPKFQEHISSLTNSLFTDTEQWQIINPIQPKTPNFCNGISIFGGYLQLNGNQYVQRITTFQDHKTLQISFKFYQIDFSENNILYIVIDDEIVYQTNIDAVVDKTKASPLCGIYQNYDQVFKIETPAFQHTSKQSIIQIFTNQPSTSTGYWGIRDLSIRYDKFLFTQEFQQLKFSITDWITYPWQITEKIKTISPCKTFNYFGGQNSLGQTSKLRKIIKNIPAHQKIRIIFTIIFTYSSYTDDSFQLLFSLDQDQNYIKNNIKLTKDQYCETATLSKAFNFDNIYQHVNGNLFLQMWQENLPANVNWGIRDFYLQYSNQ